MLLPTGTRRGTANLSAALAPLLQWIHEKRESLGRQGVLRCNGSEAGRHWQLPFLEFGYEVLLQVPAVHQACERGEVDKLTICRGRYPLYFFVPRALVEERTCTCSGSMCNATKREMADFHNKGHILSLARHLPPYTRAFRAPRAKPFVVSPQGLEPWLFPCYVERPAIDSLR
jgi:hypothetical protein